MAGTIERTKHTEEINNPESGFDGFRVTAWVLFGVAAATAFGGWDLFAANVSKATQDILIGVLIGVSGCFLSIGIYSLLRSYRLRRDLIKESQRLKAAREEAPEPPE